MSPSVNHSTNENWSIPGRFSTDPRFLFNYYLKLLFSFGFLDLALCYFKDWTSIKWDFDYQWSDFGLFLLFLYLGTLSLVVIHNSTHGNFKPKWLNHLLGEIAGSYQLNGFMGWKMVHFVHHQFPDHPIFDPHHRGSKSFFQFILQMVAMTNSRLTLFYFRRWPQTPELVANWKLVPWLSLGATAARALTFFLILGPKYFLLVMMPAYVVLAFMQTHFNYYTHRPSSAGHFEIVNLNNGLIYRVLNHIFFGLYFHKNHHLDERRFDPRK